MKTIKLAKYSLKNDLQQIINMIEDGEVSDDARGMIVLIEKDVERQVDYINVLPVGQPVNRFELLGSLEQAKMNILS